MISMKHLLQPQKELKSKAFGNKNNETCSHVIQQERTLLLPVTAQNKGLALRHRVDT
jgi:hypothetical protein